MLRGYFVTGTDTGVGKTVVSTILSVGLQAKYWKPIQTGSGEHTDSDFVKHWIGKQNVHPEAFRLRKSASPHEAATDENIEITLDTLLASAPDSQSLTIVEGAGGALVPINVHVLMTDLIRVLGLPTIVVCRSGLGTINHTLLTLEALRRRDIDVFGVVLVGDRHESNARAIQHYGEASVLGQVPFSQTFSKQWFIDTATSLSLPCKQEYQNE